MLNKSTIIALNKIKPTSISEGKKIIQLFESTVVYIIRKILCNLAYSHLQVSVNYNYSLTVSDLDIYKVDVTEYTSITYILERSIEQYIEEFNIYTKNNKELCLNFNVIIMNGNNFIISTEILKWR